MPLSPASVVAGLVVVAFGVLAAVASLRPWVGPAVIGVWLACSVGAGTWLWRSGHRGGCWLGRTLWTGLAVLGFPLRVVVGLPF